MKQLNLVSVNGQFLADSREVAEMINVRHADLLEKIDSYAIHLLNGEFRSVEFFIESNYQDSTGRTLKCYLLTKKGCDMVANKMTGEKGVLFTASYVTRFEEMEKQAGIDITKLDPQMQLFHHMFQSVAKTQLELVETRKELTEVKDAVTTIQDTFLQRDEDWRKSINSLLNSAAFRSGGNYRDLRSESYRILEERGHCDLNKRLRNLKDRLTDAGATKSKIEGMSRMDVIEADPRLKEIYTTIVKEISISSLKIAR